MPTSHFASSHSSVHAELAPIPGNARMLLIHSPADSTAIELLHRRFIDMNVQVSCTALSPRCNLQHITTCSYMRTVNKVVFVLSRGFFRDIPQWSNLFAQALELAAAGRLQIAAVLAEVLELPAPLEALAGRLPGNFEFGVPGRRLGRIAHELLVELGLYRPVRDVLCLFANPSTTPPMRLDREFRAISEANQRSGNRLYIEPYWAAHVHDLSDRMLDRSPDVVHFAGHGEPGGLLFERADGQAQWVPVEHLQRVLGFKRPRCLVLNACYSAERVRACAIPYVIAMAGPSHDEGSIEFSRNFYLALARGLDIETSFEHARDALTLQGLDDSCQPRLVH